MKIAYVTRDDPNDIHAWSGISYEMGECLKRQGLDVVKIGPLPEPPGSLLMKLRWHGYRRVLQKDYWPEREPSIARHYSHSAAALVNQYAPDADIIFSPGTIPVAHLECRQPIVFWTDATFACMVGFYNNARNLCSRTLRDGNLLERQALNRCRFAIYSSQWAADSAIRDYGTDPKKVKVVSLGANQRGFDSGLEADLAIRRRPMDRCKLVLIGVDWVRKGVDFAVQVAEELNAAGLPTELTVIGCTPPAGRALPSFVEVLRFISKSTEQGRSRLRQLLRQSHYLILPTQADATPVVFAESNGLGVPCLTTDVGGIGGLIRDGINGQKFALATPASIYATYIREMFSQPDQYLELCRSSYQEYRSRLNWDHSGGAIKDLLAELTR